MRRRERVLSFTKVSITALGTACMFWALLFFPKEAFGAGFLCLLLIAVLIAPRMSLGIPSSKVAISFSDSVVFLAFLLYGPASAVILAATDTLASCVYNERIGTVKFKGRHMLGVNAAMAALGTTVASIAWQAL